jgi:ribosomal protein S18 acetylase RimI-like enzyme
VTSEIAIAPRTQADSRQLFGLVVTAFGGSPGWSERVVEVLTHDAVFVARESGEVAGYVALCRDADGEARIDQLFVAPGHERHGVGHRLLEYAEGYAISSRAGTLRIVVEQDNRPARSFYQRWGFVPVESELWELVLPREE